MAVGAIWGTVITMTATNVYYVKKQSGGNMKMTKEEAQAFIRGITGPPHRDLEGDEYSNVAVLLKLMEPYKSTNNQHAWTDYYKIGDVEYHVTTFGIDEPPTIAEFLPE